jgi:hypothetical protein
MKQFDLEMTIERLRDGRGVYLYLVKDGNYPVLQFNSEKNIYAVRICKHVIPGIPGVFEGGTEVLTIRNKFFSKQELNRFFFWRGKKKRRRTYGIATIKIEMV